MFLAVLLVGLFAVSVVSAADSSTGDIVGVTNNDDVLNTYEESFVQLNETINGGFDKEIYLNYDYKYSSEDSSFKEGIVINRDVTVYGNGHTIDGSGEARIFHVTGGNVIFYNINFINGYTYYDGYGGAISGSGKAISCNFENNFAYDGGGAIYGGSAVNCSFVNNSAVIRGGAMFGGSAHDCAFSKNYAGDAGAMYGSSAVNCYFRENSAKEFGGAMGYAFAADCYFSMNSAGLVGGAMFMGSAVNCTFMNNYAGYQGGAIDGGSALYCTFAGNTAIHSGRDMCGGYKLDYYSSILGDFDGTEDLVLHWGVNDNYIFTYNSGDALLVNLMNQKNELVMLINFDVVVYKNGVMVKTYHCLGNDSLSFDLAPGDYVAELIVTYPGLYQPNPKNITLTINKAAPKIDVAASNVVYPNSVAVTVKSDVDGKYNVKIGSTSKDVVLKKGVAEKVIFTGLTPKTYILAVKFAGNENYTDKLVNIRVTVKKATPKLTAPKKTFKKSVKTKQYTVILKTNQNKVMKNTWVTLKVNKKVYKVKTNTKGRAIFKITNLNKKGTFVAEVKYAGNAYYNANIVKPKITVK